MYLGVRMVIAKSIERIHRANLINFCIVPVRFAKSSDYDALSLDDELVVDNLLEAIRNSDSVTIAKKDGSFKFTGCLDLSNRDREILLSAGLLNYTRQKSHG